jgi:hypothetical protein
VDIPVLDISHAADTSKPGHYLKEKTEITSALGIKKYT